MLTSNLSIAGVVSALFPGPLVIRTELGGGTSTAQGLFIEMFLTAQLVFTIFMLAAEKHKATFIAPVGIGLSLFIAELTGMPLPHGRWTSLKPSSRRLSYRWFRESSTHTRPLCHSTFVLQIPLG